ncbi:MAG: hypothetical protein HYY95_18815 [Candidatus Rokubacteria bacterium]|nr:hypothetical protein [Candidatus Rokubacteria bacterium]
MYRNGPWPGARGERAAAVHGAVGGTDGLVAYVFGGSATIAQVPEVLIGKGMDRKSVRWERFW